MDNPKRTKELPIMTVSMTFPSKPWGALGKGLVQPHLITKYVKGELK